MLVDAPIDIRLSRACSRDGVNEEMIRQRMANQQMMNSISTGLINVHVDSVVINDGTINELQKKLDEFVKTIV